MRSLVSPAIDVVSFIDSFIYRFIYRRRVAASHRLDVNKHSYPDTTLRAPGECGAYQAKPRG
jgi:hypothetical protein